jgi:hypothetical protein
MQVFALLFFLIALPTQAETVFVTPDNVVIKVNQSHIFNRVKGRMHMDQVRVHAPDMMIYWYSEYYSSKLDFHESTQEFLAKVEKAKRENLLLKVEYYHYLRKMDYRVSSIEVVDANKLLLDIAGDIAHIQDLLNRLEAPFDKELETVTNTLRDQRNKLIGQFESIKELDKARSSKKK